MVPLHIKTGNAGYKFTPCYIPGFIDATWLQTSTCFPGRASAYIMSDIPSHTYKQLLKQHSFLRTEQDRDERGIAVLVGHSFIRRLRDSFGFSQDVTDDNDVRLFARNLRVQQKFSEVYTYSSGLNVIGQLPHPRDILLIHGANLVVLAFGSNDFANLVARDPVYIGLFKYHQGMVH